MRADSRARPRIFYGYVIVVACFLIIFAAFGVRFTYGVFFRPLAAELGFNAATTSAAFSVSMVMEGVFCLVFGGLIDVWGPRIVLGIAAFLLALGYVLMSMVDSLWQMYFVYGVFVGIGTGGMFVPMATMTARWFTRRRSLMTGIVASGSGIGMLVVPPWAARLIEAYGWRNSYLFMAGLVAVVIPAAAMFLKNEPELPGAGPIGTAPPGRTALSGMSFRESLRTSGFWILAVMVFFFGFYSQSINIHIVPQALDSGMSSTSAANILATGGVSLVLGRLLFGGLGDRIGGKRVFIIGFILAIAVLLMIAYIQPFWAFFVFAVMIGFSQGGIGTSQSPMVAIVFGLRDHGLIYGSVAFGFTIGAAVGPYAVGYLFDRTGNYHVAMLACAAAAVVGLVLAAVFRPSKK